MILYDIRNALQMTDKDFGHLFGCSEQKAALYMNYRDDLPISLGETIVHHLHANGKMLNLTTDELYRQIALDMRSVDVYNVSASVSKRRRLL